MKNYLKKCVARLLLVFIVAGTFVCPCNSQAANVNSKDVYAGLGKASDPVPFMKKVRKGVLPNGLKYYILRNNTPENVAFLGLAVNAGSILEKDDERGLAHFVEHMAFKGTRRFPKDEILSYLLSTGMKFGADTNAYTGYNKTAYHLEVPIETGKDKVKRIPSKALDILDDWAHAITFNQKDIDIEKLVILEEKRLGDADIEEMMSRKIYSPLYKGSRYANRDPIGIEEIIKTATTSKLKDFYDRWYRADNMALVFVGDFDDSVLEKSLLSRFHATSPKTSLQRPVYNLPLPVKGHLDVEISAGSERNLVEVLFYYKRKPKSNIYDLASWREDLMDKVIYNMFKSRFDRESSKPSVQYASANFMSKVGFDKSSRVCIIGATAKAGNVGETIKSVLQEKERILRYGWTDSEVEQAKLSFVPSPEYRDLSSKYGERFLEHFPGDYSVVVDHDWNLLAEKKMLPLLTAKDLTEATKDYFAEDDLIVSVLAPEKSKLPSKAEICKIVKDIEKSKISPHMPEVVDNELLSKDTLNGTIDDKLLRKDPTPGFIVKETIDHKTGTAMFNLSNGSKVVLGQNPTEDADIVLYALAKGGTMAATGKDIVSARLASDMFAISSIGAYSRQNILKKPSGKQASLSLNIDSFVRSLSGTSKVKDIKALFELIYLGFTCQKFGSNEVKILTDYCKAYWINRDVYHYYSDVYSVDPVDPVGPVDFAFSKEITKTIYGNNPHFNPFEASDISRINQGSALEFMKKCANPADFTFVFFISNIDIEAFKQYIKTYIASIPPLKSADSLKNDSFERPKSAKREIYMGENNISKVHMSWAANKEYSQNMEAASKVLSEYISTILVNHIRKKLGGAYHIEVKVDLNCPPDELFMSVDLPCDPKRVDELISEVLKDIENIAKGKIDAKVLDDAKKAAEKVWTDHIVLRSLGPIGFAERQARSVVLRNTPVSKINELSFLFEEFEAVSKQDLKDIAARLLKGKYYQIILRPEKYKATH